MGKEPRRTAGLGVIRLSDQPKDNIPPKSDTRSDPAALGVHLFQLKVRERSRLMLKAVAVRPEPQDIIARYNPVANRPDPVREVQRAIDLFRKFLVDVERIGREELKPKGEMDTSEFIREMLRPQFFTAFGEYKEILWQAVTDIPGYILETYWPPAKKLFEEKIGDDDLPPAKARGSLKAEWEDHFDIEIGRLERQESQQISKVSAKAAAQNIQKLSMECGWSLRMLAKKTGLDEKQVRSHLNGKTAPRPQTLKVYADAFAKALQRSVTVLDLEPVGD